VLFLMMLTTAAADAGGSSGFSRRSMEDGMLPTHRQSQIRSAEGLALDRARSHVRVIQQALKDRGFDPGPIDGIMGDSTALAVQDYQRSEHLPPTGRLDVDTAERLGAAGSGTRMIR
jgi:peptidoglycan hydrolase-like protein with peptidoglycan-binding domain